MMWCISAQMECINQEFPRASVKIKLSFNVNQGAHVRTQREKMLNGNAC